MGIFGRDDQPPDAQPAPTGVGTKPSPTPPAAGDRTIVARATVFEGRLTGSSEIIVNGLVKGTVDASGSVTVAEQGRVDAAVHGRIVTVAGTVEGDVTADEKVELEKTARVEGNLTAPRILIKDGAIFKGQVNMMEPGRPPAVKTSSARKDAGGSTGT